ncbi:MAG: Na+/H+ antiporter subunit E, partial [Candidatus Aminicenantes bacterium]|nr:Na+/H+ antiporter subunit E [Candidatus Aminicenantes bacterium]
DGTIACRRLPSWKARRRFAKSRAVMFALLFGLWLLMSGHYDAFHVGAGVLSAALVMTVNNRLTRYFFLRENVCDCAPLRVGRLFLYVPWLILQVVVASLQVAGVVLSHRMPVNPSLVRFKTRLPSPTARVILANSITLTPGTITLQLEGDEYLVHSLIDASHSSIVDGTLPGEVAKLYDRRPGDVVTEVEVLRRRKTI